MSNLDPEPWQPDSDTAIATPPSSGFLGGTGGERGTSSFRGNANFNHDTSRKADYMGPLVGTAYHSDGATVTTASPRHLSSTGSHVADPVTVAVTASDDAPVHDVAVTLTATLTPSADYVPVGVVTFKDGTDVLGTHTLVADDAGVATFAVDAGFAAGAHSITAVYAGDANYSGATSPAHVVTASA